MSRPLAPCACCHRSNVSREGQTCSECCRANAAFVRALRQWLGKRYAPPYFGTGRPS